LQQSRRRSAPDGGQGISPQGNNRRYAEKELQGPARAQVQLVQQVNRQRQDGRLDQSPPPRIPVHGDQSSAANQDNLGNTGGEPAAKQGGKVTPQPTAGAVAGGVVHQSGQANHGQPKGYGESRFPVQP